MKLFGTFGKVVIGLSALMMVVSCGVNFEGDGDSAYNRAKGSSGAQKRLLEKQAYVNYLQATKKFRNKALINTRLRNRFIETTVNRGDLMLADGSSGMGALSFFILDIDSLITPEVTPDLKQKYALFLVTMADSQFAHGKVSDAVAFADKAAGVAVDPTAIAARKSAMLQRIIVEQLEMAKSDIASIADEKDKDVKARALIKAEYGLKMVLLFDAKNAEADSLLAKTRKETVSYYSAYDAVLDDLGDTSIYRKIAINDIHIKISSMLKSTYFVNMINFSYNPLRLYAKDFYLVDINGKEVAALPSSKIEPEFLEQKKETTKLVLSFPPLDAAVKKIIYRTDGHLSEKYFQ